MCAVIIILSIGIAFSDLLTRREMRQKARHIVIASATFSADGKILVKHDGTIPMQAIETEADLGVSACDLAVTDRQRVLSELDPRQPTFQWLYQLTYNWQLVQPLVPRIHQHVKDRNSGKLGGGEKNSFSTWETQAFRGRFIEATVLLARQLGLSVEALGSLFDRVLTTGTRVGTPEDEEEKRGLRDDESSIHGISFKMPESEGVLLFLVREISGGLPISHDYPNHGYSDAQSFDTIDYWHERGYRLTDTRFFSRTLADHMGVSKAEMELFLGACKTYAKRGTRPVVQSGGTYLGLFAVRPSNTQHGLDVLVYNFARHQVGQS